MDDPETILYNANYYKPLIDRANKLTEAYIAEHKLILTGGMAIDLALRQKGGSIYADESIPDYDIISDRNLFHANALAEILCNEGIPDISVINAFHITTVRVRMKRVVFLDATYIPTKCYKQIPYLDVGHLRVVHPHYQFIDQRLSLAHLLTSSGISLNIFNRLTKDMARNALLREAYPIEPSGAKYSSKNVSIPLDLVRIDPTQLEHLGDEDAFMYTGQSCIAGYAGFALLMSRAYPDRYRIVVNGDALEISIPNGVPVRLLSCRMDAIRMKSSSPTKYRPLINLKPCAIQDGHYEYVNTFGSRVGCHILQLNDQVSVCVASADYLLMEMLRDRIYVSEEPYSSWYRELVDELDRQQQTETSDSVWWPSINIYGREDLPEPRVFILERIMEPCATKALKPKASYPSQPACTVGPDFDPTGSHYFRIDGEEDASLEHTDYEYVLQEFEAFVQKEKAKQKK